MKLSGLRIDARQNDLLKNGLNRRQGLFLVKDERKIGDITVRLPLQGFLLAVKMSPDL